MDRFFEQGISPATGEEFELGKENARHISSVLRLVPGNNITVCDGRSADYLCELIHAEKNRVSVKVLSRLENRAEPPHNTVLFQALPKADKMEFIIQKSVELGVTRIVPFISEFTVSRPDEKSKASKHERYEKISEAAAKQCGRGIIPEISKILTLSDALREAAELRLSLAAYERETERGLGEVLLPDGDIGLFIGSEGGFSENEAALIRKTGILTVSLGSRILRTETAGIYMLSVINYKQGAEVRK